MSLLANIFKEEAKNNSLHKQGYVILDFLNTEEIQKLNGIYHKLMPETPKRFYASTHSNDKALRIAISDATGAVLQRAAQLNLADVSLLGGAFVVKPPGKKSYLPLHQDWNIVDESKTQSFNIWIPLIDVDEQNGAVRIIPESHNKLTTYRGPGIEPVFHSPSEKTLAKLTSLNMQAGQALIYNHALWHDSPVNNTDSLRIGVVYGLVTARTELRIYYQNKGTIEAFEITPDFFLAKNPEDGPSGLTQIEENITHPSRLSEKEFINLYYRNEKQPWWQKLFSKK